MRELFAVSVRYQTERAVKRGDDAHGFLVLPLIKDLRYLGPDAVTPHSGLFIDSGKWRTKQSHDSRCDRQGYS
jgi:hypothetical protein